MRRPLPLVVRLFKYVPIGAEGCWEWKASLSSTGYGQLNVKSEDGKWRPKRAHRLVYEALYGEVGGLVLHTCDNRRCVRPDHLYVGNDSNNVQDMWDRKRTTGMSGHTKDGPCPKGHTRFGVLNGWRRCLDCHAEQEKERYYLKLAQQKDSG